jgi:hypothetical protein
MAGAGDDWANGGDGGGSLHGEAGNDYLDGGDGVDFRRSDWEPAPTARRSSTARLEGD